MRPCYIPILNGCIGLSKNRLAKLNGFSFKEVIEMRKKANLVSLASIFVFFSASCSSPETNPTPSLSFFEPSRHSTYTEQVETTLPATITLTLTPTLVVPPADVLQYQPLTIEQDLPKGVQIHDSLIINGSPSDFIIRFDDGRSIEAIDIQDGYLLGASPNGKWFAYLSFSSSSPTGQWLIAKSADQQQQFRVAVPNILYFDAHSWLDDQRLIFPLAADLEKLASMVIVNPFTRQTEKLSSDYPAISRPVGRMTYQMTFDYGDVVYDPSLDLVIYSERESSKSNLVMWDRNAHSILARLEEKGNFTHDPLWSPDGQDVAVSVSTVTSYDSSIDEWFSIDKAGQIQQLTHFGDYFDLSIIGEGSWSPDGTRLAFWLETTPSICSGPRLAILTLLSKKVINTCIPGSFHGPGALPPQWSLDGRNIVVSDFDNGQTMIVDSQLNWAAILPEAQGYLSAGWLANLP
jgi:hypothetical protein